MNKFKIILGVLILAVFGYIYAGPYITLYKIKNSIEKNDPQGLMEKIDLVKLKNSFKNQIDAKLMAESSSKKGGLFGGLGTVFSGYMMEKYLDMYLTPAGISQFLTTRKHHMNQPKYVENKEQFINGLENIKTKYISLNKFKIIFKDKDKNIDIILSRDWLDWKLSEIIFPL